MKHTDDLLPEIDAYCKRHHLLPEGGLVVVGLSGGPDSTALMDLLLRLAPKHSLTIAAAHLHHGLRGEEADLDEQAVRDFCEARQVSLFVRRLDIKALARESGRTIEETGRHARYDFFREVAWQIQNERRPASFPDIGASLCHCEYQPYPETEESVRIAVGHHQDDQAETVLLNLSRGSGLSGLVGMLPRNGLVIRPLLDISRERIDRYIILRDLKTCLDQTNAQPGATRNRIRLDVLPVMREAFGTNTAPAIARAASLLRVDADFLNTEAATQLANVTGSAPLSFGEGKSTATLSVDRLNKMHPAIRTRVLRLWFQQSFGDMRDLSEKHVSAMENLCLDGRSGHSRSLPGGRKVVRVFDSLILIGADEADRDGTMRPPGEPVQAPIRLQVPGETKMDGGHLFVARFIEYAQQIIYNNQIWCFSVTDLTGAVVRHRQAGDHVQPEGKVHGRPLKKFLTERRVPASERDSLPMIAIDSEVLWIPGVTAAGFLKRPDASSFVPGDWVQVTYRKNHRAMSDEWRQSRPHGKICQGNHDRSPGD